MIGVATMKKYLLPVVMLLLFETVAVTLWLAKDTLFYLINFSYSLPAVNSVLRRCGGDAISEDAGGCWYWTSTEVSGQAGAKAWLYSLGTGAIQETPKTEAHPARIIITLRK